MDYFWGGWEPPWGIAFRIDHLAALMLLLLCVIALAIAIFSHRSILKERPDSYVLFYTVYLLLISGLLGIVTTADLAQVPAHHLAAARQLRVNEGEVVEEVAA